MTETEGKKEDGGPMTSDPAAASVSMGPQAAPNPGATSAPAPPSAEDASRATEEEMGDVELDEVDVRDLLRAALEPPPPKPKEDAVLLKGVQKRIRVRSKGKFYSDGWSTSRSPRSTYLLTSIFMLVLIAFVFLGLIPWSNGALP